MEEQVSENTIQLANNNETSRGRKHAIFIVLLFVLGTASGALIWYQKITYEGMIKNLESQTNNLVVVPQDLKEQEIENCFFVFEGPLSHEMDTSDWVQYQGTGFDIKHPKEMVITLDQPTSYDARNVIEYTATMNNQRVDIQVYKLEHVIFRNDVLYSPKATYEVNSDTWWRGEGFNTIFNPAMAVRCNPNEIGRTEIRNFPVYQSGGGADAGSSFVEYAVLMRDVVEIKRGLSNFEPVIITFTLSSGGDFSPIQGRSLEGIIQNMIIQTLDVGGTSKG